MWYQHFGGTWYLQLYGRRWRQTVALKNSQTNTGLCSHEIWVVARCLQGKWFPKFERIVLPSSSRVRHWTLEDESTMILQTVKNYCPNDAVSQSRRPEYSTISWNGRRARSNMNPVYPDTHEFSEHRLEILRTLCYSTVGTKQMIMVYE